MTSNSKYIQRLSGIGIVLILVGIVYFLFSPEESEYFPKCIFHTLTGWDCPGCGSQRAAHHLLHLHFKDAFLSNPLLIVSIPYILLFVYIELFGGKEKYPRIRKTLYGKKAIVTVLVLIVLFWIVRNLV